MLLTCNVQDQGGNWRGFHNAIVFREANEFGMRQNGQPNSTLQKAQQLSAYLANSLGVPQAALCGSVGKYWSLPAIAGLQQHNLVGHAFRSLITTALQHYGDQGIRYDEEVPAADLFPGFPLHTRSQNPRVDIVAYRADRPVALLSARWRLRHDRIDLVDEALAYATPALRVYQGLPFYAVVGEFMPARVAKVLAHCPPQRGAIAGCVHFNPDLLRVGLGVNGTIAALQDLTWLFQQSHHWR